jgi:hypothetical protein
LVERLDRRLGRLALEAQLRLVEGAYGSTVQVPPSSAARSRIEVSPTPV